LLYGQLNFYFYLSAGQVDNLTNFEPCSIISEITWSYNTPISSLHPYSTPIDQWCLRWFSYYL